MHRWDDMGLKNIWLANGYTLRDTPYGRGVSSGGTGYVAALAR
jgi:hypothetical protein